MKTRTYRLPKYALKVRRGISGLGLFALEDIPRGKFIIEYTGPIIDDDEADRRGGRYIYDLGNGRNIDGTSRTNVARYANHSCKPNADAWQEGTHILLYARRRIKAGEEITYDYGHDYADHYIYAHGCRCSADKHRKPRKAA